LSDDCNETIQVPITAEELRAAVFKGDSKKSPCRDGLRLDFFKVLWEDVACNMRTLFTHFFRDRKLTEKQKKVSSFVFRNARSLTHQRITDL